MCNFWSNCCCYSSPAITPERTPSPPPAAQMVEFHSIAQNVTTAAAPVFKNPVIQNMGPYELTLVEKYAPAAPRMCSSPGPEDLPPIPRIAQVCGATSQLLAGVNGVSLLSQPKCDPVKSLIFPEMDDLSI